MNVTKNGITLTIPDAEVIQMALDRLNGLHERIEGVALELGPAVPRIGEAWEGQGGVYAGIARGRDGGPDYHLIVGPEYDGQIDWTIAESWTTGLNLHGFSDYAQGYLKELALAFANVPELFKKEAYWSREQLASGSDDAWSQHFDDGGQFSWLKDDHLRARAFRRVLIQ